MNNYATRFWQDAPAIAREHGFCIIQGFFERSEIDLWESIALRLSEPDRLKDFLTLSIFNSLLLSDRILDLARSLLGSNIVYYGETNCSLDSPPYGAWHCDARGTPHDIGAVYDSNLHEIYPGWRFAVYFRDYRTSSGGLKVAPGSHCRPWRELRSEDRKFKKYIVGNQSVKAPTPLFPIYNIPSAPGDLVIFNLRTFHSAGYLLLKENHHAQMLPDFELHMLKRYPELFEPYPMGERNALFFDYGAPSEALDLYIKWRALYTLYDPKQHSALWERVIRESALGVYSYDQPTIQELAARRGITLRFDRIIAQLLYKKNSTGFLSQRDKDRLEYLLKENREFSPYHSLAWEGY